MSEAMQTRDTTSGGAPAQTKAKKLWRLWLAALVLVLVAGFYLAFRLASKANPTTESPVVVTVTASGFNPGTIRVQKGAEVTWVNEDVAEHKVVADQTELGMLSQEPLSEGDSYAYTFEQKGTFTYHDPLAPTSFKGTVIVE